MSDPVLDIESQETFQADEIITIAYGSTVHYLTYGTNDISHGSNLYLATAGSRSELPVPGIEDSDSETTISLPIDHAFTRRYLRMLVPPFKITVTITRLYTGGVTEQIWVGEIMSMSVDDANTTATFHVPDRASNAGQRLLPTISVSRSCPYALYGAGCTVSRGASVGGLAHKVTTTVIGVNGRDVHVDLGSTDRLGGWSVGGELVVTGGEASGERMTIREQTDTNPPFSQVAVLSLDLPIPGLKNGDAIEVYAGCDRSITTCRVKFDNKDNFGGMPSLPTENPFEWER